MLTKHPSLGYEGNVYSKLPFITLSTTLTLLEGTFPDPEKECPPPVYGEGVRQLLDRTRQDSQKDFKILG